MKKLFRKAVPFLVIAIIIFAAVRCGGNNSNPVDTTPPVVNAGSGLEIPTYNTGGQIVKHMAYTLQYNEEHEQASWVAYYLTRTRLFGGVSRTDDFREDPLVTTGSAQLDDYKYTGYDRGHMAPAGDFTWSQSAMSESFFLSNMSPQRNSFNAGIWATLEGQVRGWANTGNDTLFIATGPILRAGLPKIGARNRLSVPEYYYKAIMRKNTTGLYTIAFLMKHENSSQPLSKFAITVDSLERATGIDFFSKLPVETQADIESRIDVSKWPGIVLSKYAIGRKGRAE